MAADAAGRRDDEFSLRNSFEVLSDMQVDIKEDSHKILILKYILQG